MNFKDFIEKTSLLERLELPGEASQFKMSPPFRTQLIERYKEKMKDAKRAGVMALFYSDDEEQTRLVLILRKTYKGVHSAQIGFPGGKMEPDDINMEMTALRETFEEVGIPIHQMEIVKQLTQVYIPPSNFYVQPYLGISQTTPKFYKQENEVEAIIEVLLQDLLDDTLITTKSVPTSYNLNVDVPAFELNGHIVWGATAMMLSEIKDLLKLAL